MSTPPRPAASASDARRQLDELDALLQRMLALPVNPDEDIVRDVPPPAGGPDRPDAPWPSNTYPAAYMVVQTSGPQDLAASGPDVIPAGPDLGPDVVPDVQDGEPVPDPFEPSPHDLAPPEEPIPHPDAPAEEEAWVPFRSSWQPSPLTWQPLAESWQQSRASAPPAPPEPVFGPPPDTAPVPGPPAEPVPPAAVPPAPAPGAAAPAGWLLPLVWLDRAFDACLSPWGPPGRWLCGPAGKTVLAALGLLSLAGAAALVVAEGIGWTR